MNALECKLLILCSLVLNSPVLAEMGASIDRPIVLLFENGRMFRSIMDVISPDGIILNSMAQYKDLCNHVADSFSRGIFWLHSGDKSEVSSKDEELLDALQRIAGYGFAGTDEITSPVFIVCKNNVPRQLKENSLIVPIESESFDIQNWHIAKGVQTVEYFSSIEDMIMSSEVDNSLPLKAAVAFLIPQFRKANRMDLYEELLRYCNEMVDISDFISSEESFIRDVEVLVCDFISQNEMIIQNLDYIDKKIERYPDHSIFHDEEYIYLSETFFKVIVDPLLSDRGLQINYLKKSLKHNNLLVADKSGYTIKLRYSINGEKFEIRMMKIKGDLVPDLKSLCD